MNLTDVLYMFNNNHLNIHHSDATGESLQRKADIARERQEAGEESDVQILDQPNLFRCTMPTGTVLEARQKSRNKWTVVLQSAQTFNGKSIGLHRTCETLNSLDPRMTALADIANLGEDMTLVKEIISDIMRQGATTREWPEKFLPDGLPFQLQELLKAYRAVIDGNYLLVNECFDSFFDELNNRHKQTGRWLEDPVYLPGEISTPLHTPDDELVVLVGIALMEYCDDLHNEIVEREIEMAKNNGEKVWWQFTGGKQSITKLTATLNANSHLVVLNNPNNIFLNIQQSENKFVLGVAAKFNCKARHTEAPEWGTTLCGKFHAQKEWHEPRCNSCKRVTANTLVDRIENVKTDLAQLDDLEHHDPGQSMEPTNPDWLDMHANPLKTITINGPQLPFDPTDYAAFAREYKRVSDALFERADYYMTLAEKYESLSTPSAALLEAQEALKRAQEKEDSYHREQIESLKELFAQAGDSH